VQDGVAVNVTMPPVRIVSDEGERLTELRAGLIAMGTGALLTITPPRVALAKSVSVPADEPAVNVTVNPLLALTVPRMLVRVQVTVTPEGQVPPEHVGVAVNVAVPPTRRASEGGLTLTEVRAADTTMVTESSTVFPFNVALTNRARVPAVLPAVKVTD
jgi:hypothetical protein